MEERVKTLLDEIKTGLEQKSSSKKDEVRVMKAMLNDDTYAVDVFNGKGEVVQTFCPAQEARGLASSIISNATKVSAAEAKVLADQMEFSRSDAEAMIGISKEFVNTYLETGRKLPLGNRKEYAASLIMNEQEKQDKTYVKKTGTDDKGEPVYEKFPTSIPAHKAIKSSSPCPAYLKK